MFMGVGHSSCGSDHPNPTQPQSHPAVTPSTHLLPSQPARAFRPETHPIDTPLPHSAPAAAPEPPSRALITPRANHPHQPADVRGPREGRPGGGRAALAVAAELAAEPKGMRISRSRLSSVCVMASATTLSVPRTDPSTTSAAGGSCATASRRPLGLFLFRNLKMNKQLKHRPDFFYGFVYRSRWVQGGIP